MCQLLRQKLTLVPPSSHTSHTTETVSMHLVSRYVLSLHLLTKSDQWPHFLFQPPLCLCVAQAVLFCFSCRRCTPVLRQRPGTWSRRPGRWRRALHRWGNGLNRTRTSVRCVQVWRSTPLRSKSVNKEAGIFEFRVETMSYCLCTTAPAKTPLFNFLFTIIFVFRAHHWMLCCSVVSSVYIWLLLQLFLLEKLNSAETTHMFFIYFEDERPDEPSSSHSSQTSSSTVHKLLSFTPDFLSFSQMLWLHAITAWNTITWAGKKLQAAAFLRTLILLFSTRRHSPAASGLCLSRWNFITTVKNTPRRKTGPNIWDTSQSSLYFSMILHYCCCEMINWLKRVFSFRFQRFSLLRQSSRKMFLLAWNEHICLVLASVLLLWSWRIYHPLVFIICSRAGKRGLFLILNFAAWWKD